MHTAQQKSARNPRRVSARGVWGTRAKVRAMRGAQVRAVPAREERAREAHSQRKALGLGRPPEGHTKIVKRTRAWSAATRPAAGGPQCPACGCA